MGFFRLFAELQDWKPRGDKGKQMLLRMRGLIRSPGLVTELLPFLPMVRGVCVCTTKGNPSECTTTGVVFHVVSLQLSLNKLETHTPANSRT